MLKNKEVQEKKLVRTFCQPSLCQYRKPQPRVAHAELSQASEGQTFVLIHSTDICWAPVMGQAVCLPRGFIAKQRVMG